MIVINDIGRAFFEAPMKREVCVELPEEDRNEEDLVGELNYSMYGTRDAGAIWESCYVDCLVGMGFEQGVGSPCCFYHPTRGISVVVHGDDFTALGLKHDLDWYQSALSEHFEIKEAAWARRLMRSNSAS